MTGTRWLVSEKPIVPARCVRYGPAIHGGSVATDASRDGHHVPSKLPAEGPSVFQDRELTCRDCRTPFIFTAGEQSFYAGKGLVNDPHRCAGCRAAAKQARSAAGPRDFHAAVCHGCGGQAVVPFAPRADRPIYCSSCFERVRLASPPLA
jgi:CxxC-x17-CxxC domain-containing protein